MAAAKKSVAYRAGRAVKKVIDKIRGKKKKATTKRSRKSGG